MGAALEAGCCSGRLATKLCVLGVQQRPLRYRSGRVLRRCVRLCGLDVFVQPEQRAVCSDLSLFSFSLLGGSDILAIRNARRRRYPTVLAPHYKQQKQRKQVGKLLQVKPSRRPSLDVGGSIVIAASNKRRDALSCNTSVAPAVEAVARVQEQARRYLPNNRQSVRS